MKWVFASHNRGKIEEVQSYLAGSQIQLIPQSELGVPEPEETGLTFIENAILKARHAAQHTGLPALADDSGLEVDYLQGEPGIYSARYAGTHGDMPANIALLLDRLKGVPEAERTARFYCVMAFMRHALDPRPRLFEGVWEGRILLAPQGVCHGYNPVFYVPTHQCSAAQLSVDLRNQLSHRGQALRQVQAWF
jgi:XTP/dITP diphosphohydrolase